MTERTIPTDVHAEAFFTADHAAVHSGKLYVNGGCWTRLRFPSFPAVHNFSICVVLHIPCDEHQQNHSFAVSFQDADGQPTPYRLEGRYQTGALAGTRPGDLTVVPIALQAANFVFQRPGDYTAVLHVDGKEIRCLRFSAVEVSEVQQATPPPEVAHTDGARALAQQWEEANGASALLEQWEETIVDKMRNSSSDQRTPRRREATS